jgi:hypothetical protein
MILALDQATVTGWAAGEPGTRPVWGARAFRARSTGEMLSLFRNWLIARCEEFHPSLICFESPYIPRGKPRNGSPPLNPLTLRRLLAIAGTIEAVAWDQRIRCLEARAPEIEKFFVGRATRGDRAAKKKNTVSMCATYGWNTVSDDAADALALWAMAEATIAPALAQKRGAGPLFVPGAAA